MPIRQRDWNCDISSEKIYEIFESAVIDSWPKYYSNGGKVASFATICEISNEKRDSREAILLRSASWKPSGAWASLKALPSPIFEGARGISRVLDNAIAKTAWAIGLVECR